MTVALEKRKYPALQGLRSRMHRAWLPIPAVSILLVMAGLTGCSRSATEADTGVASTSGTTHAVAEGSSNPEVSIQLPPPSQQVELVALETLEQEEVIEATGTIAAKQTSRIGPLVEGVVERIHVRVGDRPRKGDPLFQIRQGEFQQAMNEAQAALTVAQAEAALRQKRLVRARELVRRRLMSQEEFDLVSTESEVADARVAAASASLQSARQHLEDTVVHAPFNGTVTGRFADEGVYMSNRFSMGGQSAVIELAEADIVAGIMQVPEAYLPRLALGQRALLYAGEELLPLESTVLIINDKVDPTTRLAEFRLPLRNDDYKLKPGQFVRAEVFTGKRTINILPRSAVEKHTGQSSVIQEQQGRYQRVNVSLLDFDVEHVEITSGLTPGDRVVRYPERAASGLRLVPMEVGHVDR